MNTDEQRAKQERLEYAALRIMRMLDFAPTGGTPHQTFIKEKVIREITAALPEPPSDDEIRKAALKEFDRDPDVGLDGFHTGARWAIERMTMKNHDNP